MKLHIQCAVCKQPVEEVMVLQDMQWYTVIRVRCHGSVDEMKISGEFMMSHTDTELQELLSSKGVAFSRTGLLGVIA